MSQIQQSDAQNLLLLSLPPIDFLAVQPHLDWVDLNLGDILAKPKQATEYALFPVSGLCSVVAMSNTGVRMETGLIGREGFHGGWILLEVDYPVHEVVVQREGRALKISAGKLQQLVKSREAVKKLLLRFLHTFSTQTASTALSHGHYKIEQRLARWLLMYDDRCGREAFPVTHQFLAMMLAVRRSSVTDALHLLEGDNLIQSTRGYLKILKRAGLEAVAEGSYGLPEAEYERLIAPLRNSNPIGPVTRF